ncbi:MAG: hypothetical protein JST22_10725 [Bacteroidetes bacterium]|nr:hypothetical protein [Bacteroidota bacterium]
MGSCEMTDEGNKEPRNRWLALNARASGDAAVASEVYGELHAAYDSAGRYYHTLSHISALLELLGPVRERLRHSDVVEYAVWFHDIAYDTARTDNEEASAAVARASMKRLGLERMAIPVAELVLSTKAHRPAGSIDAAYLVDADLAILGAPPDVYDRYALAIRREFAWVDDARYREGRSAVLRHFLERSPLYLTDEFRVQLESQARANMVNELRKLVPLSSAS